MSTFKMTQFRPLDVVVASDARELGFGAYGNEGEISPAAFAGALRTLILNRADYDFRPNRGSQSETAERAAECVGLDDEAGMSFGFFGPLLLSTEGTPLLPVPRICLAPKDPDPQQTKWSPRTTARPLGDAGLLSDPDLAGCSVLKGDPETTSVTPGWVTPSVLARLLLELADKDEAATLTRDRSARRPTSLRHSERRVGHRRSHRGTVEEGALFSRAVRRFREGSDSAGYWGLVRGVGDGDDGLLPNGGYAVRLGGDGHLAALSITDEDGALDALTKLRHTAFELAKQTRGVLLYLATPAIFDAGWRPPLPGGVTIEGAAVGRPRIIAGWDAKARRPKPILRAVPAGTVYFLRTGTEKDIEDLFQKYFWNEPLTDRYAGLGFGLTLLGAWNPDRTEAPDGGET